jgi:outer membrane biosynthesis protein TonB
VLALVLVVQVATSGASHEPAPSASTAVASERVDAAAAGHLVDPDVIVAIADAAPVEPEPEPDEIEPEPEPEKIRPKPARRDAKKNRPKPRPKPRPEPKVRDKPDKPAEPNEPDKPAEETRPKEPQIDRAAARESYLEGMRAYTRGQLASAERSFRAALELNPGMASAHRGLGFVHARRGSKRAAVRAFKRYLRMAPKARDAVTIRKRIEGLGG